MIGTGQRNRRATHTLEIEDVCAANVKTTRLIRWLWNGRVYTESDITLLRGMGVGSRTRQRKSAEDVPGARG